MKRIVPFAMLLLLASCGGGGGSTSPDTPPTVPPPVVQSVDADGDLPYPDNLIYASGPGGALAVAREGAAVTHHTITIGPDTLHYTATAGHLNALDAGGTPKASVFYVAYTLDGAAAGTRPVTFFYNGGPGSASAWLHMGSFGPKRLVTGDPSTSGTVPFPLVDNQQTMLPTTDLVFIDAVGTGWSQAVAPATNQSLWGVDVDAGTFRDFIARWLSVNGRQASPKFLFGESYGTTRSAVLAHLMETAGTALDGVVLQSSVLDYNVNCGVTGDGACDGYLPSYAATGDYYGLVVPTPTDFASFIDQVQTLASGSYAPAVQAFIASGTPPSATLLNTLNADTGVTVANWQAHFNLDPDTFQHVLLPGTLIGRYDARVSAPVGSALAAEGDPSSTFITAQFLSAIQSYVRTSLKYTAPSGYVLTSDAINTWNFSHDGHPLPDTVPDLAAAFALDPHLKVLSVNGYHDLATPFFQTERDLARLGGSAPVAIRYYAGGHMTYLDDVSRPLELADVQAFYAQALGGAR